MNNDVITTANDQTVSPSGESVDIPKGEKLLSILYWPNRGLIVPSEPVTEFSDELVSLINNMFGTMQHYGGVGLAAPQVGVRKKLFVWSIAGQHGVMINPAIIGHSGETMMKEQCLSFPGITVTTRRADKIKISWQNAQGLSLNGEYEGLPAICFQHETEHLEGMTMISTLSATKRDIVTRKMKKFHRMKKRVEQQRNRII